MRASPRVAVGGAPTLPTKTSVTQSHPSVNSWMGFLFTHPRKRRNNYNYRTMLVPT